ncbi:hypothetical protein HispidOSU_017636, partial [Sigmodon hispidus]
CPEIPLSHHVVWNSRLKEEGIKDPYGRRDILYQHCNKIQNFIIQKQLSSTIIQKHMSQSTGMVL